MTDNNPKGEKGQLISQYPKRTCLYHRNSLHFLVFIYFVQWQRREPCKTELDQPSFQIVGNYIQEIFQLLG